MAGSDQSQQILIAHQPLEVIQAAKEKVDLQLSGHTHAGHLFPLQIAISLTNRDTYMVDKREETYFTQAQARLGGDRVRVCGHLMSVLSLPYAVGLERHRVMSIAHLCLLRLCYLPLSF